MRPFFLMQYITYLRVSTENQGADGNGIAAQDDACQRFAAHNDAEIINRYVEVETASCARQRPKLDAALAECRKENATLLIAKLDRLARNVHFVSSLMNGDVPFKCADMPVADNLTIHILAAFAEHERGVISTRTKAALAVIKRGIKKNGHHLTKEKPNQPSRKIQRLGNPNAAAAGVIGRNRQVKNADDQAEIIYAHIERVRSFGINTLRGIAAELEQRHIKTPRGKARWHPQQVKAVIERIER